MNKIQLILCGLCLNIPIFAASAEAYLEKFQTYTYWSKNLPTSPDPEFLAFINTNTPLAQKLRKKWLHQLARDKNWEIYTQYYQNFDDVSLQCYALTALYHQGKQQEAMQSAKSLWLIGLSQPSECNELFKLLLNSNELNESLITQRIVLALEKRNLSLARYLLKQYKNPRHHDIKILNEIYHNPSRITQLETGELHDDYYLYGLKRMVSINMDQAIRYWQHVKTKKLLSKRQQQAFLVHVALYKAMRNHEDTLQWFAKVKPEFYNDALLDWQIRFALKQHRWRDVERLIQLSQDGENPSWQYWLARAKEAQGKKAEALPIYEHLAKTRNYYGFLASLRINKKFSFENENAVTNLQLLQPYQPFTDQIKDLYTSNQSLEASRLLSDFVIELPKEEKSALAYWLAKELQWYDKSLYLSNNDELNNQLSLRFPVAYQKTITKYAKNYQIPKTLVFSIIRQESMFREQVISAAGAHGLMQVMPTTAQSIAKHEHIPYEEKKQLFSPQKNINIGVAYLQYLAKRFDNHPVLIAAAYNAGPRQVNYWLKNHPPKQIDIWIETLPWHETRNYLKNIIAFYAVYQYRMHEKPDLSPFLKPF
ncbi:transglycosylase SLT domain-containing protein [Legionella nagasakiensis]|uniref:transglycosylase SLT domain-containing protein n=1 Tax=Legionella nagasakiensis TaxID=535290 RepID=UPI0010542F70|nr:transglycosylase SLT domain-containing protein [Legionella nagasakiensis]